MQAGQAVHCRPGRHDMHRGPAPRTQRKGQALAGLLVCQLSHLVKVFTSEVEASTSEVDVSQSEVKVLMSEVEVSMSEAEVSVSGVEVLTSEVKVSISEVEVSMSEAEMSTSEVEVSTASVEVSVSEVKCQHQRLMGHALFGMVVGENVLFWIEVIRSCVKNQKHLDMFI